jgi:hypothetical protein
MRLWQPPEWVGPRRLVPSSFTILGSTNEKQAPPARFLPTGPGEVGSADHRFRGPRLFGPVMGRSNSCVRIGGGSQAVGDQTAALVLFVGAQASVFIVA